MARIRTIKPGFFRSEDVAALPFRARLTWVGLWTIADDHGRAKDSTRLIKGDLWSLEDEVTLSDVAVDLDVLAEHGRIVRYTADGGHFLAITNWHLHQAINRPSAPVYPTPPVATGPTNVVAKGYCSLCLGSTHAQLTNDSVSPHGGKGKGREGEKEGERATRLSEPPAVDPGLAPEPPRRCPKHTHDRNPGPCGACGDARREHQAWERGRAAIPTPVPGRPSCPIHPDQPTGSQACPRCVSEAVPSPGLRRPRSEAS